MNANHAPEPTQDDPFDENAPRHRSGAPVDGSDPGRRPNDDPERDDPERDDREDGDDGDGDGDGGEPAGTSA